MSKICDLDKAGKKCYVEESNIFSYNYEQTLKSLKE